MRVVLKVYSHAAGQAVLKLDSASVEDAMAEARGRGLHVLSAAAPALSVFGARRRRFPMAAFVEEALALLEAGLSINEAVDAIAAKSRGSAYGAQVMRLRELLHDGARFSQAFEAAVPGTPAIFLFSVRASESTGELAGALKRYARYAARVDEVRAKAINACVYPALLLGVGVLVAMFLTLYVVPRFAGVYEDMGRELPATTQALLAVQRAFTGDPWGIAVTAGLLALAVVGVWRAATSGRLRALAEHVPGVGNILELQRRARLHRTMAMLLDGGMPFSQALRLAGGAAGGSPRGSEAIAALIDAIDGGAPIARAFADASLVEEIGQRLLRAGEDSGSIDRMFERIADYYDGRAERIIERGARLLEPAMMLLVGLMIGVIVMVLYLPIFELAGGVE